MEMEKKGTNSKVNLKLALDNGLAWGGKEREGR